MRSETLTAAAVLAIVSLHGQFTLAQAAPAQNRPRYYLPQQLKRQLFGNDTDQNHDGGLASQLLGLLSGDVGGAQPTSSAPGNFGPSANITSSAPASTSSSASLDLPFTTSLSSQLIPIRTQPSDDSSSFSSTTTTSTTTTSTFLDSQDSSTYVPPTPSSTSLVASSSSDDGLLTSSEDISTSADPTESISEISTTTTSTPFTSSSSTPVADSSPTSVTTDAQTSAPSFTFVPSTGSLTTSTPTSTTAGGVIVGLSTIISTTDIPSSTNSPPLIGISVSILGPPPTTSNDTTTTADSTGLTVVGTGSVLYTSSVASPISSETSTTTEDLLSTSVPSASSLSTASFNATSTAIPSNTDVITTGVGQPSPSTVPVTVTGFSTNSTASAPSTTSTASDLPPTTTSVIDTTTTPPPPTIITNVPTANSTSTTPVVTTSSSSSSLTTSSPPVLTTTSAEPVSTSIPLPSSTTTTPAPSSIDATGTDSATTLPVPTSIFFAPTPTSDGVAPGGKAQSSTAAGGIPTTMPRLIQAPGGLPTAPEDFTLIQLGFDFGLNYPFVVGQENATFQIFAFLPQGVAYGLNIPNPQVVMKSLMPYDTSKALGYITTLAQAYIPTDMVTSLEQAIHSPNGRLYSSPDTSVRTIMSMINPTIPLLPGAALYSDPGNAAKQNAQSGPASTNGGGAPIGGDSGESQQVKGSTVGISIGAVAGAAVYAAAMVYVARRYRQNRRQRHQRSLSAPTAERGMSQLSGGGMGSMYMSGANGRHSGSAKYSVGSRNSGHSSNGRSVREQGISNPIMSENSLGWN